MSEHDAEGKQPQQGNAAPWPAPSQPRNGAQWGQPFGNVPYGNAPYGNAPSGNSPYANVPYGNPTYSNPPYAGHPFAGQPHGSPFGQPRYAAPPKPGIVPLRPLMFGEIMDGSFQTIRRNARAMLGAAVLAQALAAILAAVLTAASATSAGFLDGWTGSITSAEATAFGVGFLAAVLVFVVLSLFISAVLQGAMVVPVARSVLNRPTGFRLMWALARSRAGALLRLAALLLAAVLFAMLIPAVLSVVLAASLEGPGLLVLIPVFLGFIALYLWLYIKLMVAPAAVVVEELGAMAALRRSWSLTRGNWWRILGITLVVGILVGVISQVITIPISLLTTFLPGIISPHGGSGEAAVVAIVVGIVTAVVTALVGALGYAFQTSVMALIYLDLRMRKDGLDISLLRLLESGADMDGIPGRGLPAHNTGTAPGGGPAAGAWPDVR